MDDKNYYKRQGYVSNSSLNYIDSPKQFQKCINGELEQESKSYFDYGQLSHLRVLELDEWVKNVMILDYTKPKSSQQDEFINKLVDANILLKTHSEADLITLYKECYKTKESDEKVYKKALKLFKDNTMYYKYLIYSKQKTVIDTTTYENILDQINNIKEHKLANKLMFLEPFSEIEEHNEYEILWEYDGVKCKSLLDRFTIDRQNKVVTLIDYKTSYNASNFSESFKKYSYDRQMLFYAMALVYKSKELNIEGYDLQIYMVVTDTKNHECIVFKIEDEDLIDARKELTIKMQKAKFHIEQNLWDHSMNYYEGPGYERIKK